MSTCTVCAQPILDGEPSRRNLIGAVHVPICPTADLVDAVVRWASAHPRVQPDRWREVCRQVDQLDTTGHLTGLAGQAVEAVRAERTATSARYDRADYRKRGVTAATHGRWRDARTALAAAASTTPTGASR